MINLFCKDIIIFDIINNLHKKKQFLMLFIVISVLLHEKSLNNYQQF